MEVVVGSGQHDIGLCHFQDVEVGEAELVLSLVRLEDDHPAETLGKVPHSYGNLCSKMIN